MYRYIYKTTNPVNNDYIIGLRYTDDLPDLDFINFSYEYNLFNLPNTKLQKEIIQLIPFYNSTTDIHRMIKKLIESTPGKCLNKPEIVKLTEEEKLENTLDVLSIL